MFVQKFSSFFLNKILANKFLLHKEDKVALMFPVLIPFLIALLLPNFSPFSFCMSHLSLTFLGHVPFIPDISGTLYNFCANFALCAWQIAAAMLSVVSSNFGKLSTFNMVFTIFCTCILSARPYPTTDCFICKGVYS